MLESGHFWKVDKVSYWVFSENYSPLKEINLQEEDIEWRAPWIPPDKILYRCGIFDWVPLLGIWGAVGYVPLLVLRQLWLQEEDSRDVQCLELDSTDKEIGSRLDIDVQKLEIEKLRKVKNKAEGDLDSLKTDYKKLRFSIRTT
ncbi:hypothetical protein Goklo_029700, partial [Gossypium klotzschianum]|nr:hypothetical protein [Gossypium klotzschianum]